jgi:hypothetical protein
MTFFMCQQTCRDGVVHSNNAWEKAAMKRHHSMQFCFHGNIVRSEHGTEKKYMEAAKL